MKKRVFAVLFAMMMLAGCGGAAEDEHAGHDHAKEQETAQEQEFDREAEIKSVMENATEEDRTMMTYLQGLPAEISADYAAAEGMFTINDGTTGNEAVWDAFAASCSSGAEAEVVICQFTTKGGAVLDYVKHHADGTFTVVTDTTRDGYDDEKSTLRAAETYTDMKIFENFSLEAGAPEYTVCVLSDNPDLTADEFRTHWINMTTDENHIYMLYVI